MAQKILGIILIIVVSGIGLHLYRSGFLNNMRLSNFKIAANNLINASRPMSYVNGNSFSGGSVLGIQLQSSNGLEQVSGTKSPYSGKISLSLVRDYPSGVWNILISNVSPKEEFVNIKNWIVQWKSGGYVVDGGNVILGRGDGFRIYPDIQTFSFNSNQIILLDSRGLVVDSYSF